MATRRFDSSGEYLPRDEATERSCREEAAGCGLVRFVWNAELARRGCIHLAPGGTARRPTHDGRDLLEREPETIRLEAVWSP